MGACLEGAVIEGYGAENPVKRLPKTARPRAAKSVPSYFTDAELAKLWTVMPADLPVGVFLYLCKTAVATGMRQGELLALRWPDVKLLAEEIEIKHTYAGRAYGESAPKNGKTRTVDLNPAALGVLEEWLKVSGANVDSNELVFAGANGAYLVGTTILRSALYPAMEAAGIPREGEHGRKRNFHSFRDWFARLCLQGDAKIDWVKDQLGHSSITLTIDTYGHWDREAQKKQAAALFEGAFAGVV